MTHKTAIKLVSEITGYDISELSAGDDVITLDLWDSIAHVNIILAVEAIINRPIATSEVLDLTSIDGIQNLLDGATKG